MSTVLSVAGLGELVAGWIGQGKIVAAPVQVGDRLMYQALATAGQAVFDADGGPPTRSRNSSSRATSRSSAIVSRARKSSSTRWSPEEREQIVIGARPCDAAALPILDHVFNWDSEDDFYTARRERTTVVTLACAAHDEACFCTSVGLGPGGRTRAPTRCSSTWATGSSKCGP